MSNKLTGKALAEFVITKIKVPYVYGAKGANGTFTLNQLNSLAKSYPAMFSPLYKSRAKSYVGKVCTDCSGLISWYTGKSLGSAQMYSSASKRGLIADVDKAPIGAVLWKSGHVGVKVDNTYCVEAKGINYGTVKTKITDTKWTHWLLFDYMDYEDVKAVTTKKAANPYVKPSNTIRKGMISESVKWLQFELLEAGFTKVRVGLETETLTIDGEFGEITESALKAFQQSSKLKVDGLCGSETIKALLIN